MEIWSFCRITCLIIPTYNILNWASIAIRRPDIYEHTCEY